MISNLGWTNRARRLAPLVAASVLLAALLWGDDLLDQFRLDPDDTIYDYMTADVSDAVAFYLDICKDGACLAAQDWACGFDNGDRAAFDACFDSVVENGDPWYRLSDVRRFCGHRTMKFVGTLYSNPDRCETAGGRWGVPSQMPLSPF